MTPFTPKQEVRIRELIREELAETSRTRVFMVGRSAPDVLNLSANEDGSPRQAKIVRDGGPHVE